MKPDWFSTDSNQSGLVWNARKSDYYDAGYHRTIMTVKDAGQGGPQDDEVFTYYSLYENNTDPAYANGTPFLMHAPSPMGMVVNEVRPSAPAAHLAPQALSRSLLTHAHFVSPPLQYYDFEPRTYAPDEAAFIRPASPACIPAGYAATPAEARALLQAAGVARPPMMVEVMLGGLNLALPAEARY